MMKLAFLCLTLLLIPQAALPPGDAKLKRLTERADVIVVAEVKEVEPMSGGESDKHLM